MFFLRGFGFAFQMAIIIGIIAVRQPKSWLGELVFSPQAMRTKYFVAAPGNELSVIFNSSPYVGWYRCPNVRLLFVCLFVHDGILYQF